MPRLYVLILLCVFTYLLLIRQQPRERRNLSLSWTVALIIAMTLNIAANLRHQQGLYADYQWRIFTPNDVYMAAQPVVEDDTILFIAFMLDGYHSALDHFDTVHLSSPSHNDHLAVASTGTERWVEEVGSTSTVVPVNMDKAAFGRLSLPWRPLMVDGLHFSAKIMGVLELAPCSGSTEQRRQAFDSH